MSMRTRGASAAILTLSAALVAGCVNGAADARADGGDYCANLPDAAGLYAGNPVTQMGVRVGKVRAVQVVPGAARVTFRLEGPRRYPQDVKAVARAKSLLADRSLELVGNYREGPMLQPHHCIALNNAFTPKSISEITGSAAEFIDTLVSSGNDGVQQSIRGLSNSLDGIEDSTDSMFRRAAQASRNPDQVISDIGATIMNMAPLTDEALREWGHIGSIVAQLPETVANASDLVPKVAKFDRGVGWLVAVLYDIQRNYGDIIWPLMDGPVTDIIRLAAARAPDLQTLYSAVPSIAAALRRQVAETGGLSVPYRAPTIAGADGRSNLLDLVLRKARR